MRESILQYAEHHESVLSSRIGAWSMVMEPSVPKTCVAIAAVLGLWLVLAPRRQR
jgi:hypothetical protein